MIEPRGRADVDGLDENYAVDWSGDGSMLTMSGGVFYELKKAS